MSTKFGYEVRLDSLPISFLLIKPSNNQVVPGFFAQDTPKEPISAVDRFAFPTMRLKLNVI